MEEVTTLISAIGKALYTAFVMFWDVLWPLILGFGLSAAVQAVVSHKSLARLLGDNSPKSFAFATLFGVASSSCYYAAVAVARSILRQRASFTVAMVIELAARTLAS